MIDLNDLTREHMLEQPHQAKCSKCGEDLTVTSKKVDHDLDMFIEVDPCEYCMDEAATNAAIKAERARVS